MGIWRVNNSTLLGGEVCSEWQANHAYGLGARCVCTIAYGVTTRRAFVYEATVSGTSHATTEPVWINVPGNTIVDNGVTWTCRSPDDGNWDNASCFLFYITQYADSLGSDDVYVDDGHAEHISAILTLYYLYGSNDPSNFRKIYCVDKADDSLSVGAVVWFDRLVSANMYIGGFLYSYGITYRCKASFMIYNNSIGTYVILESDGSDVFHLDNANEYIQLGSSSLRSQTLQIINGRLNFQSKWNEIRLNSGCIFKWFGGSIIAPNGIQTLIGDALGYGIRTGTFRDIDLSAIGSGVVATSILDSDGPSLNLLFERCKLPSDAGFTIVSGTFDYAGNGTIRCHHCSASNNTYDFHEASYEGIVDDETSIYRDDGFVHNATHLSQKMISTANTIDRVNGLISVPIHSWTDSTGSTTFTVEGVWDSAANIQNDEIWMELEYPANNTDGLGAVTTDRAVQLAAAADQAASAEDWTGTGGMANVNKFKLSVTVTPGKAGPITARVYLAKPSTTVYIDPVITET